MEGQLKDASKSLATSNSITLCGYERFILSAVALRLGDILSSKLLLQEAATSAEGPARVIMDNKVQMPVVQFQNNIFSSPRSLCTAIFFLSLCS